MLEGKKVHQISVIRTGQKRIMIEDDHIVQRLKKWLPAGPLPDGTVREKDIIQFIAKDGGIRTINADDLVL